MTTVRAPAAAGGAVAGVTGTACDGRRMATRESLAVAAPSPISTHASCRRRAPPPARSATKNSAAAAVRKRTMCYSKHSCGQRAGARPASKGEARADSCSTHTGSGGMQGRNPRQEVAGRRRSERWAAPLPPSRGTRQTHQHIRGPCPRAAIFMTQSLRSCRRSARRLAADDVDGRPPHPLLATAQGHGTPTHFNRCIGAPR